MSTITIGNYISNAELMAWMAEKTNGLYADMSDAIDLSNDRTQMVEDLQNLRTEIQRAKDTGKGWKEIQAQMQAILDKYGDGPYGAELRKLLGPMKEQVGKVLSGQAALQGLRARLQSDGSSALEQALAVQLDKLEGATPTDESLERWMDKIDDKTDKLGKEDQLAMIAIQDINSRIAQTTQLASNLIDTASKTLDSVVGNIRG